MVELGDPGPGKPVPPRRRRSRRRRVGRAAAWALGSLVALAVLALGTFLFLTRTDRGSQITIRQVLKRLPLNAEITVDRVRSNRLLEGVRLFGLRITGADGRAFLVADSATLSYDWRTLVGGAVVFDELRLFHPDVVVSRYPGEDEFNVQRLFISDEEAADTATGPPPLVVFENVRIVDGDVRVLFPQEGDPAPNVVTVPVPEGGAGGLLRRMTFRNVRGAFPRIVLSSPSITGQLVDVDSLSALAGIYRDPFTLRSFRGRLTNRDRRVDVDVDQATVDGSSARGSVYVELPATDAEPLRYGFNLRSDRVELADFTWVDPRVPTGIAQGGFALVAEGDRMTWTFNDAHVNSEGTQVELGGTLVRAPGAAVRFQNLDVRSTPVALSRIQEWLPDPLPLREGTLSGSATLDGTLARLRTDGRVTLRTPGTSPTTAAFEGILHLGEGALGFTDLRATLDPVDFGLLARLQDGFALGGSGRVRLRATGRLDDAIRFDAEIDHRVEGAPSSHVRAQGNVRQSGGTYVLDVQGDLSPLSLTALRRWYPDLPVTGEVSGSVRAAGPLTDLRLNTDLATVAGRLALDVRLDATNPTAHYSASGDVADLRLSRLVPSLPDPTVITGRVNVEGRGSDPAALALDARLNLRPGSRVGGLTFDTAAVVLRVADGVLNVDTLDAVAGGIGVQGRGSLAMEPGGPAGTVTIAFQADSLAGLRPLLFGDSILVRDELSGLEREVLALEGVDADTLPSSDQVRVGGSVEGRVTLTGSVRSFDADGEASFERVAYGSHVVQGAQVTFSGTGLPALGGNLHARILADSLLLFGREFAGADVEVDYARPEGRVSVVLERHLEEDYRARARFQVDTLGGRLEIEELALRFDSLTWELAGPTTLAWTPVGLTVENLVLVRPGENALRIEANGVLPTEGEADFRLHVENLHLERVAGLMQREDMGMSGLVDAELEIRGRAERPVITGRVEARDVAYQGFGLSLVSVDVDYQAQDLRLDLAAWSDSLRVLTAQGTIPANLALQAVEDRFPDRPMDLRVTADSLPAAFVLAPLQTISEVEGTVSGEFTVAGTVASPEPQGTLALNRAGMYLEDIGVRYRDMEGTLTLRQDGRVEVDATGRAGGTVSVTGTVGLQPLTDPSFDLDIRLAGFRAVQRVDVEGDVSGNLRLTGSYRRPLVTGDLVVDRGVLYLEEFLRASTVVDLSDPRYFEVVDTTLFSSEPLLRTGANPFMQNLRVSIDMEVRQDTWLRSEELNVEIGGGLIVTYDRSTRDIVLVGELEAVRGSYTLLGRGFVVDQGTVEFVGTPGINPNLSIQASTEVRQSEGRPIDIVATVTGTLGDPQVTLSSDETALSQSDLVSYLIFGRPSYALASGQQAFAAGAAGSLFAAGAGAVGSVLSGTVAARLSSLLAQQWGFLDYFAITQVGDFGLSGGGLNGGALRGTVVELGSYLDEDLFLTFLLQPFAASGDQFAGARLEWQVDNYWTVEAFIEERFLRGPSLGFQQLDFGTSKVGGFFIFWERGY